MLLNVTRMKPLVSSNALIQTVHNDGTSTYKDIPHGLHYTGHVVSDPDSLVALRENKGLVSWPTQIKLPLWVCFNTFVVQCIIHGEVPHYRKLKGHEIKVALIFLTLISVPLMKWGVNFCDLNFHYFGHKFSIHFVRGVFCQGGDSPVTVKLLWRFLKVVRLRLIPLERLGKEPRTKFPFGITHRLTLFLLSQHVQVLFLVTLMSFILNYFLLLTPSHSR